MVRRRVGLMVMLALLTIGALLSLLPADAGAIRLAGLSVTWWYAIVLAPAVATVVGLVVGGAPAGVRSVALWATPALFVPVATQIFTATPAAPLVALAAMLAPIMARLVRARDARSLPRPLAAGLLTGVVALVAWANFLVVADAARGLGGERWHGLALAAPIALALAWRGDTAWRLPVLVASVGLLAISVVAGAGGRFESGRRVPGAPLSGVEWADATAHSALGGLLAAAGAVFTLVGGGVALLASPRSARTPAGSRVALSASVVVIVLIAVCWGVYAADVGADLALGGPAAAAFVRLPSVAISGAWGGALAVATAVAIIGLLMTAVTTLADRAAGAWTVAGGGGHHARALRAGVVIVA